jgi:hypothetical protein
MIYFGLFVFFTVGICHIIRLTAIFEPLALVIALPKKQKTATYKG